MYRIIYLTEVHENRNHTELGWVRLSPVSQLLPVVVKPSAVAGNDDVVSLFSDVILTSIYQPVDFTFALFLIILERRSETAESNYLLSICDILDINSLFSVMATAVTCRHQ